ncbi:hypothetical protein B0H19DRAFT_1106635 [Mycena capillaripes]|nr:hypothetical protein B0H19DRAFT_1106635 [Mycena capillaripes]
MSPNMSIPKLQQAARMEVYDARRNGTLDALTARLVRQALEVKYNYPKGTLDAEEFKIPIKSAITAAATEDMETAEVPIPQKKRKSEEMLLEHEPKGKQTEKPQKPKKSSKKFKSSETVPTSDIEDMEVNETESASAKLDKAPAIAPSGDSAKATSPKKLKKSNPRKDSGSVAKPSPRPSTSSTLEPAANSDSELSVLDDEPPKKTKKPKTTKPKDKDGDKSKASKGKKGTGTALTKDEETIKRLKSLVVACGVRKVWAKVFSGVDSPSQQIRILKEILTDLGMSGRMSLEQAKAIKEKRELAQELEDVQAFAAAATRSKAAKTSQEEEEEESSSEEELPAKRKTNARKSIMDFLGDQSDDD